MSQRTVGISETDKLKETVQLLASLWEAAQRLPEGSDRQDALEQIVGEIEDEFDVTVQPHLLDTGALVLEGGANIRDLESHLHIRLPRDEGFETLGGFIMWRLGRLPQTGDSVEYEGRRYTVLQMHERRVVQVKVEALSTPEPQVEEQPSLFNET